MIAIVDYGLGNIRAFANLYKGLNIEHLIADKPEHLEKADKIILPGVGAFDYAMTLLNRSGLRQALEEMVLGKQTPVLGICVGMQIMVSSSEEGGSEGLGWIDGEVRRFPPVYSGKRVQLPHMGWNDVQPKNGERLFNGLEKQGRFYFLHSYYLQLAESSIQIATTSYCACFPSAIRCGNIYGVQFHPEKSHGWGIQLLKNFAEI